MKRFSLKESCFLFILLFFIFSHPLPAEIWRSFTSMDDPHEIVYFDGCIWGAAEGGLFKFHLADSSFDIYTLADGLKGEDFLCLEIDSTGKIWSSGTGASLNVLNPASGEILSFTYLNSEAEKLTDIFISGASIFTASNNGVYEYYYDENYDEYFVRGGYNQLGNFDINTEVRSVWVYGGYLWAGTNAGIARIALSVLNKQPPLYWENFTTADGLPAGPVISFVVLEGDLIAATQNNGIAKYNQVDFETIPIANNTNLNRVRVLNDTMYSTGNSGIKKLENGSWVDVGEQIGKFYDVISDDSENIWGAKSNSFYVKGGLKGFDGLSWNSFSTNTPAGNFIRALMVDSQGRLWCGGISGPGKGVYVYDKGVWTNYTAQDSAYSNKYFYNSVTGSGEGPRAFLEHPNGEIWVASFGSGVAVFRPDGEQYYYSSVAEASKDSIPRLAGIDGHPDYCPAGDMVVDADNNIWIVNRASGDDIPILSATADFLVEHSPNIEWLEYTASDVGVSGATEPYFDYLIIDQQNRLWYGGDDPDASGVGMLDFNNTPYDKNDDLSIMTTTGQGLKSTLIYDLTIDGENRIWVATGSGVNSFYIPEDINSTLDVSYDTPYILDGIKTNCIAVDPMQNKWFGTDDGIVVLSEDNYTILNIYSVETHPLLANEILDITFNAATGEAFIATNKGISSLITPYRSFSDNIGSLELYPVPFIPDGNNLLRFGENSLIEGVTVKIFTHTGLLVKKLSFFEAAYGWNGTDSDGKLVGSGIYLIVVASDNGQSATGKAAVIRK